MSIVELQGGDPMPPVSADTTLGADFNPEPYAFTNAIGNSMSVGGKTKRPFLPEVPVVNCERLIADTVPHMGKVNEL